MTIAVIGTNGKLAPVIIKCLKDPKFNTQPLILISRDIYGKTAEPATASSPSVEYVAFDNLASATAKADILIATHAVNRETYGSVYSALNTPSNRVKLYFPASFGFYDAQVAPYLPQAAPFRREHFDAVRKLGIKTVTTNSGSLAIPGGFLYDAMLGVVGFDTEKRKVRYIGTGEERFNVSHPEDIARSLASLVGQPTENIPDDLVIFSDSTTPRQVVKQYTDRNPMDVDVEHVEIEAFTKKVQDNFSEMSFPFDVLPTIMANGLDKGLLFSKSHRELVNPSETLWKWHKYL